jgi:hypothetical protein
VYLKHYRIAQLILSYLSINCDFFLLLGNFLHVVFKKAAERREGRFLDLTFSGLSFSPKAKSRSCLYSIFLLLSGMGSGQSDMDISGTNVHINLLEEKCNERG